MCSDLAFLFFPPPPPHPHIPFSKLTVTHDSEYSVVVTVQTSVKEYLVVVMGWEGQWQVT